MSVPVPLLFRRRLTTLPAVVDWGLCIGCGACAYACKRGAVRMVHVETEGYRPVFDDPRCLTCTECVEICPGAHVNANLEIGDTKQTEADHEFGPVLEIWEGWASDPAVRYKASSGGLLSALSLYCLEVAGFAGVVHAGSEQRECDHELYCDLHVNERRDHAYRVRDVGPGHRDGADERQDLCVHGQGDECSRRRSRITSVGIGDSGRAEWRQCNIRRCICGRLVDRAAERRE